MKIAYTAAGALAAALLGLAGCATHSTVTVEPAPPTASHSATADARLPAATPVVTKTVTTTPTAAPTSAGAS